MNLICRSRPYTLWGDVHATASGTFKVVWFKDTDGNTLTIATA
jgi:hypothetical protein